MTPAPTTLTARLAAWPRSAEAARPVPSWGEHPLLARYPTAGHAAIAARTSGPLFDLLASRSDEEESVLAAVSVACFHLVPVIDRWARAGLPRDVLDDMDAGLVAETLAGLGDAAGRSAPQLAGLGDAAGRSAPQLAGRAWHRVAGRRRTERARADRHVCLDVDRHTPVVAAHTGRLCLTASAGLVAVAALSGWGPADAPVRLGISPAAWRARTSRARRWARAEMGER